MGHLVTIGKAPDGSSFNQWKIYRSTTQTGTFTEIDDSPKNITDQTFYDESTNDDRWYKTTWFNSSTDKESAQTDAFPGHTTSYTTVQEIKSFIQFAGMGDSDNPNTREIIELIWQAEDHIDNLTKHAWRLRRSNTQTGQVWTSQYELYDNANPREYKTGAPIYLKHRIIRALDTDLGDTLEYWNGSDWENWLTDEDEGRAEDWWLDDKAGIVYRRWRYNRVVSSQMRIKYRYGELTLNHDIKDVCKKLVAIDILTGMDSRSSIVPEGSSGYTHKDRVEQWTKDINKTLNKYKEMQVPSQLNSIQ